MKGHVRERGAGNWYAVIDLRDPAPGSASANGTRSKPRGSARRRLNAPASSPRSIPGLTSHPTKPLWLNISNDGSTTSRPNVAPRTHERYGEIVAKEHRPPARLA